MGQVLFSGVCEGGRNLVPKFSCSDYAKHCIEPKQNRKTFSAEASRHFWSHFHSIEIDSKSCRAFLILITRCELDTKLCLLCGFTIIFLILVYFEYNIYKFNLPLQFVPYSFISYPFPRNAIFLAILRLNQIINQNAVASHCKWQCNGNFLIT